MYICLYVCMYIHTYTYIHIHMQMHVHERIHTHMTMFGDHAGAQGLHDGGAYVEYVARVFHSAILREGIARFS